MPHEAARPSTLHPVRALLLPEVPRQPQAGTLVRPARWRLSRLLTHAGSAAGGTADYSPGGRPVSDHSEFMAFARRILRALSRRIADADPEDLADLVAMRAAVDEAIDNAARAVHANGASWAQIGAALGVSKQAAQQRWGSRRA